MQTRYLQLVRQPLNNNGGVEIVAKKIHALLHKSLSVNTCSLLLSSQDFLGNRTGEIQLPSFEFFKLKIPYKISSYLSIIRIARNSSHILLHLPDPFFALTSLFLSYIFHLDLVVFWHADHGKSGIFGRLLSAFEKFCLNKSIAIICTSPKIARESSLLRFYPSKIRVLPLFCDVIRELPIKSFKRRQYDCVYIGRIESYKNVKQLIDDFMSSNARSLAIAGGGKDLDYYKNYASNLVNDQKEITFFGPISNAHKYQLLCDSKMFILSSQSKAEAFAIVQCEAFACGTPVLSYDIYGSGVSWVNVNGSTGFTPKCNHSNHSTYINYLLDPDTWTIFSLNCLSRSKLFTPTEFGSGLNKILSEL